MKLYFANTSPYSRKARVTVYEKGLDERVETIFANPFEDNPGLKAANPLGKVPVLIIEEGHALCDSPVICAFLDSLSPQPALIGTGSRQWDVRAGEALTDGILDAAFAIVMERRRPDTQRSPLWVERWTDQISRATNTIEASSGVFDGALNLAQIGLGVALGYLDFRLPDLDWREGRPRLAAWYATFAERPAMKATAPQQA